MPTWLIASWQVGLVQLVPLQFLRAVLICFNHGGFLMKLIATAQY